MATENKNSMEWHIPEYVPHKRSKRWYIIALSAVAILIAYAILTANFLFALILIVVSITMALHDRHTPRDILFAIGDDSIIVGQKRYQYSLFKNFWLYYEPGENKMLFLEYKNGARPRLGIPIANKNPLKIRTLLLQHMPEDTQKENEPLSEQLSRLLKL